MNEPYSLKSARSVPFLMVIAMILAAETGALHALLIHRLPLVAWALTASSVSVLLWLIADYVAMGRSAVRLGPAGLEARVGRRSFLSAPLEGIAAISAVGWRDLSGLKAGYLNATKPATPNVLITFREPVEARIVGLRRPIEKLGLHLDQPEQFVAAAERALGRDHEPGIPGPAVDARGKRA